MSEDVRLSDEQLADDLLRIRNMAAYIRKPHPGDLLHDTADELIETVAEIEAHIRALGQQIESLAFNICPICHRTNPCQHSQRSYVVAEQGNFTMCSADIGKVGTINREPSTSEGAAEPPCDCGSYFGGHFPGCSALKEPPLKKNAEYFTEPPLIKHRDDKAKFGTCKCFECAVTKRELAAARQDAYRECAEIALNIKFHPLLDPGNIQVAIGTRDRIVAAISAKSQEPPKGGGECGDVAAIGAESGDAPSGVVKAPPLSNEHSPVTEAESEQSARPSPEWPPRIIADPKCPPDVIQFVSGDSRAEIKNVLNPETRIALLHRHNAKLERELAAHVTKIRNQKTEIQRLQELHTRASAEIERLKLAPSPSQAREAAEEIWQEMVAVELICRADTPILHKHWTEAFEAIIQKHFGVTKEAE